MSAAVARWGLYIVTIVCLIYVYLILTNRELPDFGVVIHTANVQNFKIMFISIVLEAFPFILLGVVVSALLQAFVSEQMIQRLIPKNPLLGILYACVIGIIFPICECGMIPIMRRLIRKGMPVYIAAVFIVAGPILNPIVFASTYMAFRSRPEIAYSRMGLAFVCAIVIGLIVYRFVRFNPMRQDGGFPQSAHAVHSHSRSHDGSYEPMHRHTDHQSHDRGHPHSHDHGYHEHSDHEHHHSHGHSHHEHGHHSNHQHEHDGRHAHSHHHTHSHGGKWHTVFTHASDEFFEMGKYLVFGAFLAALVQTIMSRDWLVGVGTGEWSSHLFMMGFAYLISLCSTSDAFVASSFVSTFSTGSIISFLVFGPMLDFKGTLMLAAIFRMRFVLLLSALIFVTVLAASMAFERLFL